MSNQLLDHSMHREYIALVEGVIPHTDIKIDAPLGKDPKDRLKRCVDIYEGKEAITHVHVLERFKYNTLVQCKLETGRTHQIRVHMEYIGHPVVNDPVYGRRKKINDYGQMLHAAYLGFEHPITKKYMEFETKPESEFEEIVDMFRNS